MRQTIQTLLNSDINLDDFYDIGFNIGWVRLQGKYNCEIIKKFMSKGDFKIKKNGFCELSYHENCVNFYIVLT